MHHHTDPWTVALAHWLLTGVSVLVVGAVLPGVKVKSYGAAVGFAIVAGVLNAIAWHFLAPLSFAFAILTLGIGALVINGLLFVIAGKIVPGVEISGCITAAIASLGVTFVNWLMRLVIGGWAP